MYLQPFQCRVMILSVVFNILNPLLKYKNACCDTLLINWVEIRAMLP